MFWRLGAIWQIAMHESALIALGRRIRPPCTRHHWPAGLRSNATPHTNCTFPSLGRWAPMGIQLRVVAPPAPIFEQQRHAGWSSAPGVLQANPVVPGGMRQVSLGSPHPRHSLTCELIIRPQKPSLGTSSGPAAFAGLCGRLRRPPSFFRRGAPKKILGLGSIRLRRLPRRSSPSASATFGGRPLHVITVRPAFGYM